MEIAMNLEEKKKTPIVGILMGSDSDYEVMKEASKVLERFGISHEMRVISAHRSPEVAMEYGKSASARGISVIIAGAGLAAHLAGAIAANTILPVIGVPLAASSLGGYESLLSTVMMPAGVPVAAVAIGKAGAINAALLAVQILALSDEGLRAKLEDYRKSLLEKVIEKDKGIGAKS